MVRWKVSKYERKANNTAIADPPWYRQPSSDRSSPKSRVAPLTQDKLFSRKTLQYTATMAEEAVEEPQYEPEAEAEEAEVNGDITGAIRLYNKAYRLDPSLE